MSVEVRDHVSGIAGVLSVVSLGLVFAAAGGVVPSSLLPHAPESVIAAIPHVNAGISILAIGTIGHGWRAIRRGNVTRHRAAMATAFLLFGLFLGLYLYRVALVGPREFPGPATLERFAYLPILAIHILLAIVCVPLLYYVLLLALTRPVEEIPLTDHPRFGRITATLWLVSFALGVVVYALLYLVPYGAL
jgi:putative membrane protein